LPFDNGGRLVVAASQLVCSDHDNAANLQAHLACIEQARRDQVDLLLFPELSLTGYQGGATASEQDAMPSSETLSRLAGACGQMAVSVGLPEEGATGLVYNTQLLLQNGAVVHRHRKINLPTYGKLEEGKRFAAGRTVEPVRIGAWRIATLICADTWNPALPWLAALAGADLLLVPVASAADAVGGFDQHAGWDVNLRHTAVTYGMPLVMANHAGPGAFWGGSRVLDADGRALARLGNESGVAQAEISLAQVRAARRRLPTVRDANPAVVMRELRRQWFGGQR
jgi:predicted amidohydrolase